MLCAGAVAAMIGTALLRTRRAEPDRGSGRCCGLGLPPTDAASQVGLEPHRAWTNRRGATAGASIPPSAVGSRLPLA
ncbi:hypothetical protein [Streptomyces paradoxus]|uniref:hypothetical protein n=1 Tax=Streptomyces paradoxus TaxID=66375 RepID=UPI0038043016